MIAFSWKLAPQQFADVLAGRKRLWRKRASSEPRIAKRVVSKLTRKSVKGYKAHWSLNSIPKALRREAQVWTEPDPAKINIVVMPRSDRPGSAVQTRRDAKRILAKAFSKENNARIEMISSRKADASRRKPPPLATARIGSATVSRAILLESFGTAICPPLTEEEIGRLRDAGATVLDNELLSLDEVAQSVPARVSDVWHLDSVGAGGARSKGLTGKGVLIGIADTGIEPSHPEFAGKQIFYQSFSSAGRRRRMAKPKDFAHHGTHVSALCAGKKTGIAPGAQLAVAAIFSRQPDGKMSATRSQILTGLNWLARGDRRLPRPVDIINISWGREIETNGLYDVIETHLTLGILTVAAIGNGGAHGADRHHSPANFDNVLAVGSVDRTDAVSRFSAWGRVHGGKSEVWKPEMVAPGEAVVCARPRGVGATNGYVAKDGTSFAAPIVAGGAALLIEHDGALRGDARALKTRLLSLTAESVKSEKIQADRRRGAGRLDLTRI